MPEDEGQEPDDDLTEQELRDEIRRLRAINRQEAATAAGTKYGLPPEVVERLKEVPRDKIEEEAQFYARNLGQSPPLQQPQPPPDLAAQIAETGSMREIRVLQDQMRNEQSARSSEDRLAVARGVTHPDDVAWEQELIEKMNATTSMPELEALQREYQQKHREQVAAAEAQAFNEGR